MKIESKIGKTSHSDQAVFSFLSDFRNFESFIPEGRITKWDATDDRCSFRLDPVGEIGMLIQEKEPYKLIKIISDPSLSSQNFTLWIQIKAVAEGDTRIKITIEPNMNRMMLNMVKGQIKKGVDMLMGRVENFDFKAR